MKNVRIATLLREIAEITRRKHFTRPEYADLTTDQILEAWAIRRDEPTAVTRLRAYERRFGSTIHLQSGVTWMTIGQAIDRELDYAADSFRDLDGKVLT